MARQALAGRGNMKDMPREAIIRTCAVNTKRRGLQLEPTRSVVVPHSIVYRGDVSVRKRSARHNTCCACCFITRGRAARAERKQHTHNAQNAQNAQHGVLEADLEAEFRHAQNA